MQSAIGADSNVFILVFGDYFHLAVKKGRFALLIPIFLGNMLYLINFIWL